MVSRLALAAGLLQAHAAPAATPYAALVIPAPSARIKTTGGPDGTNAWNLWDPGELGDDFRLNADATVTVRARVRGTPALGVWPRMALMLDQALVDTRWIETDTWSEHIFRLPLQADVHRLTLAFLNDARTETEDRNLYVESLTLETPAPGPSPALAEPGDWSRSWKPRREAAEAQTLREAEAAIERIRKRDLRIRVLDAQGRPRPDVPVSARQVRHAFLFGCNIYQFDRYTEPALNDAYRVRFRELFNYATLGFYWKHYEPEQGRPDYPYTDQVVAWCQSQGIAMKGHPVLWDHEAGRPTWLDGRLPTPEEQEQRVRALLGRYADRIRFWEVVNEPAHCHGIPLDGPYRWARDTASNAVLIVNDYYVLANGCPDFYDLLRAARQRGVPFDAIGIQAHEPVGMRFPLDQVRRILDLYAGLGLPLHITEFTPASGGQPILGSHLEGAWDEERQADYAVKFYTACFAHPAVEAITWWDLSDQGAWQPGGGLLRADLSPKPAYHALRKLLTETWRTRAEGRTGADGAWGFRGFPGDYAIRLGPDPAAPERTVTLGASGSTDIILQENDRHEPVPLPERP
jgi:GH35 family endo-1,4-beta-xylanase